MTSIPYISDLPFPYWLLAAAIALLAFGCLTLILIVYSRRTFSLMQERKKNDLRFRYQYFLYDALVESQKNSIDFQHVVLTLFQEENKKHKLDKQVLMKLLIDLKRSFTGSSEAQLLQLAKDLQLPEYAYQKLQNRRWSTQAQGIRELSAIHVSDKAYQSEIAELRTSSNLMLSQEAQISLVKLSNPPDLSFLNDLRTPLSHWHQIHLYHHLRTVNKEFLPDFGRWLSSENESIVIFSLRMMAEFEQRYHTEVVLQQLGHNSGAITLEAIRTVKQLRLTQAVDALVSLLQHNNPKVQLASLQAIGQLGSIQHLSYLNPLLTHQDYWIRRTAQDAILQLQQTAATPSSSPESSLQPSD
ncbi:MAG: HEAT repeat domain-containing protein [Cyclobacteriaceae bacterium]